MLNSDDNYIPVDDAMQRFEDHLLSHDRVVLSAKFGDGKTFFLKKVSISPLQRKVLTH